jgi:3-hydroxyacyl-[acyl-carrier-protein] dehydratase
MMIDSTAQAVQPPLDIKEVLKMMPHRYPFIMLDRVLAFERDKNIIGLKNVSMNEPFFQGHFPEEPVMPGVLMLEGMAQAGTVLAYLSDDEMEGKLVYFTGLDKARFRRVVRPGDQLIYKVEFLKRRRKLTILSGKAYVEDALAAEATLLATFF